MFALLALEIYAAEARAVQLREFQKLFQEKDETLKKAEALLRMAEAEAQSTKSQIWSSTLWLEPSLKTQDMQLPPFSTNFKNEGTQFEFALKQEFPTGTSLSATATKFWQKEYSGITDQVDSRQTLTLSQNLWQDAFGASRRATSEASEHMLKSQKQQFEAEKGANCITGLKLYLKSWLAQEKSKYRSDMYSASKESRSRTDVQYKKRLAKKLDWIASQADAARAEDILRQAQFEERQAKEELRSVVALSTPVQLATPAKELAGAMRVDFIPSDAAQLDVDLKAAEEATLAAQKKERAAYWNSRIPVTLFATVGTENGKLVASSVREYSGKLWQVGLKLVLPIHDPARESTYTKAHQERVRSELGLAQSRRVRSAEYQNLRDQVETLSELVSGSEGRQKLFESQLHEARTLFETGRIEFDSYLRYRDAAIQERIRTLELQVQLWQVKAEIARTTQQTEWLCGGKI